MANEPIGNKRLFRNTISYFGTLVMGASFLLTVLSLVLQLFIDRPGPYAGIFTFMVFPSFGMLGLAVFVVGIVRERRRRITMGPERGPAFPSINLNNPQARRKFSYFVVFGFGIVLVLAFVSYQAFHYTESVPFCGQVCHTVMQPEYTSYLASPHARVACVECHVGSGAQWYVKSKLSGVRQVFAVLLHTYSTPIEVPIRDLRPARETCEECHWPEKFYGARLQRNPHFRYDEKNTAEQVNVLVNVGGGTPKLGPNAGIHWHVLFGYKVRFKPADRELQEVPWVSVTSPDGTSVEFVSKDSKLTKEQLDALPVREMSCLDCHNRPTHIYAAPDTAMDRALAFGAIPADLPWIKKVAVDALTAEYADSPEAHEGIRKAVLSFYEAKYPAVARTRRKELDETIQALSQMYDRSVFPKMKVNWKTYASNIGHRNWPGCFRCHDGKHATPEGRVLKSDCTMCHTMPTRGTLTLLGEFVPTKDRGWHPFELKGKHAEILCSDCHSAGYRPPADCAECHTHDTSLPMGSLSCDGCHQAEGRIQPQGDCGQCHDSLKGLHRKHALGKEPVAACTDCHKPHDWKTDFKEACSTCHEDETSGTHYPEQPDCNACHSYTEDGKKPKKA